MDDLPVPQYAAMVATAKLRIPGSFHQELAACSVTKYHTENRDLCLISSYESDDDYDTPEREQTRPTDIVS